MPTNAPKKNVNRPAAYGQTPKGDDPMGLGGPPSHGKEGSFQELQKIADKKNKKLEDSKSEEGSYGAEEEGEEEQEEMKKEVMDIKRQHLALTMGVSLAGSKGTPHELMLMQKDMAKKRKAGLTAFCMNHNYTSYESVQRLLDIFYEQKVKEWLDFQDFIKFLRTDENQQSNNVF